jgi:hypothetical protein
MTPACAALATSPKAAAHAGVMVAQAASLPAAMDMTKGSASAGTDSNPAPGACLDNAPAAAVAAPPPPPPVAVNTPAPPPVTTKSASVAGSDPSTSLKPTPPKPAPLAYVAPARSASKAPAAKEASSSGWLANAAPAKESSSKASKASSKGSAANSDLESAAAADALAKAQLEASLH